MDTLRSLLTEAYYAAGRHSWWIAWNLFLAFIPLALSVWLFRRPHRSRSWLWWLGFAIFVAFLPNAPYLLTDIIHLIEAIRAHYTIWTTTFVLIPLHSLAILAGFEAYVLALINLGSYIRHLGKGQSVMPVELTTHALCAAGIYLGRFKRFNSWDFVTQPDTLLTSTIDDFTSKRPLAIMAVTFVGLTALYWMAKQVTLGIWLRWRYSSLGLDDVVGDPSAEGSPSKSRD